MNWLDLAIVIVLAVGLIKGLFDGLVKQVVSLASFILAIFLGGKTAQPLRDFLIKYDSITQVVSPQIITAVCYILAFIVIIFIFNKLAKLLKSVMASSVSCLNHIAGGFLGCLVSLLLLSLLFNVLTVFDPESKTLKLQTKQESAFFYKVEAIIPLISPYIKDVKKNEENLPEPVKDNQREENNQAYVSVLFGCRHWRIAHFVRTSQYAYRRNP